MRKSSCLGVVCENVDTFLLEGFFLFAAAFFLLIHALFSQNKLSF